MIECPNCGESISHYVPKDGVPRDCVDFRMSGFYEFCMFSSGCAKRAEKRAFCHNHFVSELANGACLGIWDEKDGLERARKICDWALKTKGDPRRFNQEEYNEVQHKRHEITMMAIENARRDGDLGRDK